MTTLEQVKSKGILFKAEMVRAIQDGRKTQTRRLPKCQPYGWAEAVLPYPVFGLPGFGSPGSWIQTTEDCEKACGLGCKPQYKVGDVCYVKETWRCRGGREYEYQQHQPSIVYRAGVDAVEDVSEEWRPSIFMPRWAARIWLEVIEVRCERLQNISEADADAEGVTPIKRHLGMGFYNHSSIDAYACLWNTINKKPGTRWEDNPWVFAYTFKQVEAP